MVVTYPDGSKDEVVVTIKVAEKAAVGQTTSSDKDSQSGALPQTGVESYGLFGSAALSVLAGLGLIKKKEDEE